MRRSEPLSRIVRPLRGGQITIPADFRRRLGIAEDGLLLLTLEGGELRIKPLQIGDTARGANWFRDLYEQFAPVREEASVLSEEEVDAAIRDAVAASRSERKGKTRSR